MITAVTFDFWNTLMQEGSVGLFGPRVAAWEAILGQAGHDIASSDLLQAHRSALTAYQGAWLRNDQFTSKDATSHIVEALGLATAPEIRDALEASFVSAGINSPLVAAPGAHECLGQLRSRGLALAVICDIGLTPSGALEAQLDQLNLRQYFDALIWSDVVGRYKPDPLPFTVACAQLGIPPSEAVHVGDRTRTDVAGARSVGMKAVRYRSIYDDPEPGPEADLVLDDLAELPARISDLG